MGFLGKLIKATVGVAISPVVAIKDVIIDGDLDLETTRDVLEESKDNLVESFEDLGDGELL